jgi:CelD/BcsL family acetyltransferase involved in cellulose biosynthesis
VLHWWFPAYDRKFSQYSPGIILLLRMAQALALDGVRAIDLGKGEARYKSALMTGAVELREGFVELPSLMAQVRRLRRAAEARAASGGAAAALRLPLKAIRRFERGLRFRP